MRRRRSRTRQGVDVNSLADIVTCSVGIVLLMMLQGVLASGDIVAKRRLPKLHESGKERIYALCEGNTVRPFRLQPLVEDLVEQVPPPTTYHSVPSFIDRWDGKTLSDGYVVVEGFAGYLQTDLLFQSQRSLDVGVHIRPAPGGGADLPAEVADRDSHLNRMLDELDPEEHYVSFIVDPGSIEVFLAAADVLDARGFGMGWQPFIPTWPLSERLTGEGDGSGLDLGTEA
ncbi:MAG: hypothetical protein U9R79_04720 [Armatimonadota bacterium]|nr:hypothetical protein [Armatimonadota bacterium]